ncbi:hypothetical protein G6O69_38925 [Pseudenhygromyxa sp. WMMC2535]|uniref:hypothetical protein n=1 Tax=Pseudenhygromyxa sp. WMMC2535 TaxID=2712867 RepID=UPI00159583B3|nr:hypothetical protein [Pseudenhygromyxa sp. WMMC2535]NVB43833.1 hypothetical protein [Pseudenhygromyxa sp. WMMC2535]
MTLVPGRAASTGGVEKPETLVPPRLTTSLRSISSMSSMSAAAWSGAGAAATRGGSARGWRSRPPWRRGTSCREAPDQPVALLSSSISAGLEV